MLRYIEGWSTLPEWNPNLQNYQPNFKTTVSVIIPARNEADNILQCLNSILAQTYPRLLLEIIVIDDHSEDNTAELVNSLKSQNVHLLHLGDFVKPGDTRSFKKKAIETAIAHAKGELIVTTDADCITQPNWIALLVSLYEEKQPKFIAAPVNFYEEKNTLEKFQSLDFMGMMGITGAGIHRQFMNMCNGANLAYPKSVFEAVGGFSGIDHLASGDDMLLLQKIAAQYPHEIAYLKSRAATVFTHAKPDWKSFIRQRVRWATKSGSYKEYQVTAMLAVAFFFCWNILFSFLLLFWNINIIWIFVFQIIIKAIADWFLLSMMSNYFGKKDLLRWFIPSFFLHIAYIIVAGTGGNFIKKYEWKGRVVR